MRLVLAVVTIFSIGLGVGTMLYLTNLAIEVLVKLIELLLYILIASIGISIATEVSSVKEAVDSMEMSVRLIIATVLGSVIGGVIAASILHSNVVEYLAVALGMGWYTFTGSYLATIDSYLGLLGFTANMLREIITYILYPVLSRRYAIEAISIGGATTMDTTLPIIARFTDSRTSLTAFIHGLILTLIIPVVLPILLH